MLRVIGTAGGINPAEFKWLTIKNVSTFQYRMGEALLTEINDRGAKSVEQDTDLLAPQNKFMVATESKNQNCVIYQNNFVEKNISLSDSVDSRSDCTFCAV